MGTPIFLVVDTTQPSLSKPWKRAYFWCPGCGNVHCINVDPNRPPEQPTWEFNGDSNSPTVTPSILVTLGVPKDPEDPQTELFNTICNSEIHDGNITFDTNCTAHDKSGQTLPLPPLPDWLLDDYAK